MKHRPGLRAVQDSSTGTVLRSVLVRFRRRTPDLHTVVPVGHAGGSALAQSYAGATEIQRVSEASISFKYSTLGLMSQIDGTGTTSFTRDNTGLLVGERLPGGSRFYYLYDGLGSVVGLTDSTGAVVNTYSYEPYGKTASSTGTTAPIRGASAAVTGHTPRTTAPGCSRSASASMIPAWVGGRSAIQYPLGTGTCMSGIIRSI